MLHAILHGKAGRIELEGKSHRWRDIFKCSEDFLTATVFGRVPHLSDQALQAFMFFLLGENARNLTGFQRLELWPKLASLPERHYVEPDVLLHFEEALVVVEVKPPFGGGQYKEQWLSQMNAVVRTEEFDKYESRLYYVALGNIQSVTLARTDLPERFVQMTLREWEPLHRYLQTNLEFQSCRQDSTIRDEWLQAFELFGMAPYVPECEPLLVYAQQLNLDINAIMPQDIITQDKPFIWGPLFNYARILNLSSPIFSSLK